MPKWLGILVVITSLGYFFDTITNYLGYTCTISLFTFFGEVLFGFWILIKGIKAAKE
ncbi:MAG: DUF4386 family protein [Elusimicrobia bacterium]|nr:DUF4386 family protein [Elusimicrobiota bacterium]